MSHNATCREVGAEHAFLGTRARQREVRIASILVGLVPNSAGEQTSGLIYVP